jgi:hypothetical protein
MCIYIELHCDSDYGQLLMIVPTRRDSVRDHICFIRIQINWFPVAIKYKYLLLLYTFTASYSFIIRYGESEPV